MEGVKNRVSEENGDPFFLPTLVNLNLNVWNRLKGEHLLTDLNAFSYYN